MRNAYDVLVKNRSLVAKRSSASMFNQTTWRMFRKGESEKIKKFLMRQIGDGCKLASCRSKAEYNAQLASIVRRFCSSFKMNAGMKHRSPGFGHASKVVNLYIKHLLLLPEYLAVCDKRNLETYAHVPLDKWVLRRIWGYKEKRGDFRDQLKDSGRRPTLNALDEEDYFKIQQVLADAARKRHVPAIAYDYVYGWRDT